MSCVINVQLSSIGGDKVCFPIGLWCVIRKPTNSVIYTATRYVRILVHSGHITGWPRTSPITNAFDEWDFVGVCLVRMSKRREEESARASLRVDFRLSASNASKALFLSNSIRTTRRERNNAIFRSSDLRMRANRINEQNSLLLWEKFKTQATNKAQLSRVTFPVLNVFPGKSPHLLRSSRSRPVDIVMHTNKTHRQRWRRRRRRQDADDASSFG